MGEWGRRRVREALSWDASAKRLVAAYSFLFGGPDAEQSAQEGELARTADMTPATPAERPAYERDLSVHH
jgi:hypothetical protein